MKNQPLVSVCVITYNSEAYVLETLESIKAQTYKNIELIISDDNSLDSTMSMCETWLHKNASRFINSRVIKTSYNIGAVGNCQFVFSHINTEYFIILAGDDYLSPYHIESCIKKYIMNPHYGLVFTSSFLVFDTGHKRIIKDDITAFKEGNIFSELLELRFWPKTVGWMFRKSVVKAVGEFDTNIWVEDFDIILRIAFRYTIGWVKEYLSYYRLHNANSGKESLRLILAHIDTLQKYKFHPSYQTTMHRFEQRIMIAIQSESPIVILRYWRKRKDTIFLQLYVKVLFVKIKRFLKEKLL